MYIHPPYIIIDLHSIVLRDYRSQLSVFYYHGHLLSAELYQISMICEVYCLFMVMKKMDCAEKKYNLSMFQPVYVRQAQQDHKDHQKCRY